LATGEPFDKAGSYAIQGRAGRYVPRVEGCYFNIVVCRWRVCVKNLRGWGGLKIWIRRKYEKGAPFARSTFRLFRNEQNSYCFGLASGCVAALCFLR